MEEDFRTWIELMEAAPYRHIQGYVDEKGEIVAVDKASEAMTDGMIRTRVLDTLYNLMENGYLIEKDGAYTFTSVAKGIFAKK